jgi:hypothetical protein
MANLQKSYAAPKIGEQRSEKYVHFFIFNWLNRHENFYCGSLIKITF